MPQTLTVKSFTTEGTTYQVTIDGSQASCTCPDFRHRAPTTPGYQCKHCRAVLPSVQIVISENKGNGQPFRLDYHHDGHACQMPSEHFHWANDRSGVAANIENAKRLIATQFGDTVPVQVMDLAANEVTANV